MGIKVILFVGINSYNISVSYINNGVIYIIIRKNGVQDETITDNRTYSIAYIRSIQIIQSTRLSSSSN